MRSAENLVEFLWDLLLCPVSASLWRAPQPSTFPPSASAAEITAVRISSAGLRESIALRWDANRIFVAFVLHLMHFHPLHTDWFSNYCRIERITPDATSIGVLGNRGRSALLLIHPCSTVSPAQVTGATQMRLINNFWIRRLPYHSMDGPFVRTPGAYDRIFSYTSINNIDYCRSSTNCCTRR